MKKMFNRLPKTNLFRSSRFSKVNTAIFACLALALLIIFASICFTHKTFATSSQDLYVAQSSAGSGDGADCADADAVSFFNNSSNWGSSSGQIGPGTTVHLCGAVTTNLTFYGSGTSGSPITLLFESGANVSMPACPAGGCIDTNGQTYLTIDGGTNGIVQSTEEGSGLANPSSDSLAISASHCGNCTIKNLTIQNMYIHTSDTDTAADTNDGIDFSGSNLTIADNTMHDIHWALVAGWDEDDSNVKIYGNNIYNIDHGLVSAAAFTGGNIGPIYFYDNHIHDMANWDTTSNRYHHDGIHCYSADAEGYTPHYNGLYIYNNRFDGTVGNNATAWIFLEGGSGAGYTPCADSTSKAYIFNNVITSSDGPPTNTYLNLATTQVTLYNNTIVGPGANSPAGCFSGTGTDTIVFQDNIVSSCNHNLNGLDDSNNTYASGSPDYNLYANGGTNTFVVSNPPASPSQCQSWGGWYSFSAFSDWQQCTTPAADPHSQAVTSAALNSDGSPQASSAAIGLGTNLTSICSGQPNPGLGALCSDINGNARPATGDWDAGAYEYTSGSITGDINGDGIVNILDLSLLLSSYSANQSACTTNSSYTCDLNSDGTINILDLSLLLSHYGT